VKSAEGSWLSGVGGADRYPRALLTEEWTPLEPGRIDHKYYVRGIGEVSEETFKGPLETSKLVSVSHR
jgi:hypothetical protein